MSFFFFFLTYPAPPSCSFNFSAHDFRKGCDGTLYQEVKGEKRSGKSQLCFLEVKWRRSFVASKRVIALWEVGDQPVHTGGQAVRGSLIVRERVTVLAVVGVHLFPWEWVEKLIVSCGRNSE